MAIKVLSASTALPDVFRFRQFKATTVSGQWVTIPISSSFKALYVHLVSPTLGYSTIILVQDGHATMIGNSSGTALSAAYGQAPGLENGNFVFYAVPDNHWQVSINISSNPLEWVITAHY